MGILLAFSRFQSFVARREEQDQWRKTLDGMAKTPQNVKDPCAFALPRWAAGMCKRDFVTVQYVPEGFRKGNVSRQHFFRVIRNGIVQSQHFWCCGISPVKLRIGCLFLQWFSGLNLVDHAKLVAMCQKHQNDVFGKFSQFLLLLVLVSTYKHPRAHVQ